MLPKRSRPYRSENITGDSSGDISAVACLRSFYILNRKYLENVFMRRKVRMCMYPLKNTRGANAHLRHTTVPGHLLHPGYATAWYTHLKEDVLF